MLFTTKVELEQHIIVVEVNVTNRKFQGACSNGKMITPNYHVRHLLGRFESYLSFSEAVRAD